MVAGNTTTQQAARLVERNLSLAPRITARLRRSYPWIDYDELRSYSYWGLTMAAREYTAERGCSFTAFASRKAVYLAIDAMRKDRVLSRRDARHALPVSLSQCAEEEGIEADSLPDPAGGEPQRLTELGDLLRTLLAHLADDDRRLLLMHYADGMSFREISRVFRLSESAVCLRHKAALAKLRRLARARLRER